MGPRLQNEIWLEIISYLPFEQLFALSLVSRRLCDLCSAMLLQERNRLRATYTSITLRNQQSQPFLIHSVLFEILRGQVPASCIFELICDEGCLTDPDEEYKYNRDRLLTFRHEAAEIKTLVWGAVERSEAILPKETETYTTAICAGDEDAALALLMPMLTNLRHLRPPLEAARLRTAVTRIAISTACERLPSNTTPKPLSNLVLLSTNTENGESGMNFSDLESYAALPSIRRIVIHCSRSYFDNDYPGWPAALPLSRAVQVYFSQSSVLPAVVQKFSTGFAGPCVMRQWWRLHGSHIPDGRRDVEWDYLLVEGGERDTDIESETGFVSWKAGSRRETMELRYRDALENTYGRDEVPLSSVYYEKEMNDLFEGKLCSWRDLH